MFLQVGWTALHHAAHGGSADVVDLLLSHHPDMITQTSNVSKQITLLSIFIHDHTMDDDESGWHIIHDPVI